MRTAPLEVQLHYIAHIHAVHVTVILIIFNQNSLTSYRVGNESLIYKTRLVYVP